MCAENLLSFCHTVKTLTQGEKLTGAYFGYVMGLAWNITFFGDGGSIASAEVSTQQASGHLGLHRTLHSPDIDFFVSPYSYAFRSLGGEALPMQPSEALRHHGKLSAWRSVYMAWPDIPAPVLRGIARYAGVHLYNEDGDVLYATPDLLSVHPVSGGPRTFTLPKPVEVVYDLFGEQVLARNTSAFSVDLPEAATALCFTGQASQLKPLAG